MADIPVTPADVMIPILGHMVSLEVLMKHYPGADTYLFGRSLEVPVQSSNVQSIGYNIDQLVLYVTYKGDKRYGYYPVSLAEAIDFLTTSSHGTWVWDNLRVRGTKYGHQKNYWRIK